MNPHFYTLRHQLDEFTLDLNRRQVYDSVFDGLAEFLEGIVNEVETLQAKVKALEGDAEKESLRRMLEACNTPID